jgi:hypothetical protein
MKKILLLTLIAPLSLSYANSNFYFFNGQPIDSICFFNLEDQTSEINLQQCGFTKQKLKKSNSANRFFIEQGFIGYDWTSTDQEQPENGYSYYKPFPINQKQFWVYTVNNSGGTGSFSAIKKIERSSEHHLKVTDLTMGDRCNGGITDVSQQDNTLIFGQRLTAFDLYSIQSNKSIKAYDDLASCAVCCYATAYYQVSNTSTQPRLMYIKLNDIKDKTELSEQGQYQQCFNGIYLQTLQQKNKLSLNELNEFVHAFEKKCLNNK